MVDKKKELSGKDLKKATGGAFAAGETGGHKHGGTQHGPRAGYVGNKPVHDAGGVGVKNPLPGKDRKGHIRPV